MTEPPTEASTAMPDAGNAPAVDGVRGPAVDGVVDPILEARAIDLSPLLVRPIDLRVGVGESVWVSGASGIGKSSLLRVLARLSPCRAGSILLQGQHHERIEPVAYRSRVMFLHQRPPIYPGSVTDNLRYFMNLRPDAALPWETVDQLGHRLGLDEEIRERSAKDLSGGELTRLGLLRLMALDPVVLILDEPFASLDLETASQVAGVLDAWLHQGPARAILGVSHASRPLIGRKVTWQRMTREGIELVSPDKVTENEGEGS